MCNQQDFQGQKSLFSPFAWLLAFAALSLFFSAAWVARNFSQLSVEALLYTMTNPLQGVDAGLVFSFLRAAVLWPLAAMGAWAGLLCVLCRMAAARQAQPLRGLLKIMLAGVAVLRRHAGKLCMAVILVAFGWFGHQIKAGEYMDAVLAPMPPGIIDTEYVPLPDALQFSARKNLIWVFMESEEATFANAGIFGENLMPGLSSLPGVRFANHLQVRGTSWTAAGLTGYFLGLPLIQRLSFFYDKTARDALRLRGAKGLVEALNGAGYDVWFSQGADLEFGRKDSFLLERGFAADHVKGYDQLIEQFPDIACEVGNWGMERRWGVHDAPLLSIARQEISSMAFSNKPFAYLLLSVDGHAPLALPKNVSPVHNDFRDVLLYCDNQFTAFARWAMAQPWYENTVLVFTSDHLIMGDEEINTRFLSPNQDARRNFNLIMNSPLSPPQKERVISHFDMLPTVLEAVGAKLPERRLGLGVSLFSGKPTLAEIYGNKLDERLWGSSTVYDRFMGKGE